MSEGIHQDEMIYFIPPLETQTSENQGWEGALEVSHIFSLAMLFLSVQPTNSPPPIAYSNLLNIQQLAQA